MPITEKKALAYAKLHLGKDFEKHKVIAVSSNGDIVCDSDKYEEDYFFVKGEKPSTKTNKKEN